MIDPSLFVFQAEVTAFEGAIFLGFRAEGPAIYLAQPIGLGCEA